MAQSAQPMEFGAYLKQLLEEKGVSASELARRMAYKSRNTIFRILDDEGGHASRQAFYNRLLKEDPLGLTDGEEAALATALEVSRVGVAGYLDNLAMTQLLSDRDESLEATVFFGGRGEATESTTLREILKEYVEGSSLELEISGCCSRAVFGALRDVLLGTKHRCTIRITHYVYTGSEEIIANIAAIQPMLYAPCYTVYSIPAGAYSTERERIYRSNCICAHVTQADGDAFDEALILTDADRMIRFGRRQRGGFELAQALFEDENLHKYPIKSDVMLSSMTQGLAKYIGEYERIEHNRAVYTIKLDIPFNFIHPDILVEAAREGFCKMGLASEGDIDALIAELYEIQLKRWNNTFTKRKPTHIIFSRRAMEEFARTGKQSDHFFALRSYTGAERVSILTEIRKQAEENDCFSVYFFREDFVPPCMEITLYEGVGVLLSKPFTDYHDDHAEAIIAQNDFCQCYKAYFFGDLLEQKVISQEETLGVLDKLIAIAKGE